jgi:predicted Rossmann fold nucleotide-binding protein DprA/Smf involved in DNA uptake
MRVLALGDPDYPQGLQRLNHPPEKLWVLGQGRLGCRRWVAVIGARSMDHVGESCGLRPKRSN